ncbi:MAG: hypothetical protein NC209_04085 [Alistipes sp.]|nr:hypothetical protein [Lachnospiraceae bacterium]MCM1250309.1 hypothetical protein [Alistipes sp.]
MKSKKAEAYMDSHIHHVYEYIPTLRTGRLMVRLVEAMHAIELAEQETEKRMRNKAIRAFKRMCVFRDQRCKPNCKGCSRVKHFIKELNEA